MCEALKILGYIDTYHGFKLIDRPADGEIWDEIVDKKYKKKEQIDRKDLDRLLGDCAAITDMPAVMLWRELIASYPEDAEKWFASFNDAVLGSLFSRTSDVIVNYIEPMIGSKTGAMTRSVVFGYFGASNVDQVRHNARSVYKRHNEAIRKAAKPGQLLDYRLGSGWKPLCDFLGKEVPLVDFPNVNEQAALKAKIVEQQKK